MKTTIKNFAFGLFIFACCFFLLLLASCERREIKPEACETCLVDHVYRKGGNLVLNVKKHGKKGEVLIELESDQSGKYYFAFEGVEYELIYISGPFGASVGVNGEVLTVEVR